MWFPLFMCLFCGAFGALSGFFAGQRWGAAKKEIEHIKQERERASGQRAGIPKTENT